jgi:hypothetical protein
VPLGRLADRIVAFLRAHRDDPQSLISWRERNRHALREFWARADLGLGRAAAYDREYVLADISGGVFPSLTRTSG